MGQRYCELSDKCVKFITRQRMLFVGTATADRRVKLRSDEVV